jgi:hypothetical protein
MVREPAGASLANFADAADANPARSTALWAPPRIPISGRAGTSSPSSDRLQPRRDAVGHFVGVIPADAEAVGLDGIANHYARNFGTVPQPNGSSDGRASVKRWDAD